MFLDEARIASGIEHANVARTFDLGDEHGVLYLAMEWVDGDALSKIDRALEKKGDKVPVGVLLRIMADTCSGLHAAHELRGKHGAPLGVVHRDVSPHNILVSAGGVAKLIDFGIAKARDRGIGETNAGTLKGKIHYMAPEQALGGAIDRRADIWAVGAVLYHLLSGKPPFSGDNQLATLHQLASGKPPPPLPATVHPAVAGIVRRALAHDREKRFSTADGLRGAIEAAMVSARHVTTTADVAAFVAHQVADRAAKRGEAIRLALDAAEERARVHHLLAVPMPDSSVSDLGVPHPGKHRSRESISTLAESPDPSARLLTPPSVPTQATLGMAAVESSVRSFPGGNLRRPILAAVGVVGVLVGILGTIALRSGTPSHEKSGPASAKTSVATPPQATPEARPLTAPTPSDEPSASRDAESAAATSPPAPVQAHAPVRAPPTQPHPPPAARQIPKVIDNGF